MTSDLTKKLVSNRRVDKVTGCWLWTGYIGGDGYGRVSKRGKQMLVHRVIMEAKRGQQVNHKRFCSNRHCFNVEHLYFGTQSENMLDAVVNGTHAKFRNRDLTRRPRSVT